MRLNKLIANLKKNKKLPYLVTNLTNICYLTGFEGSYGNLIIDEERIFFITDSRYTEYAESILQKKIEIIQQKKSFIKSVEIILKQIKKRTIFIEPTTTLAGFLSLKKQLSNFRIVPADDETGSLRIEKDEDELAIIRQAVDKTDQCFSNLLKTIRPGMTEWDISTEIEYYYRKNGCRKTSFDSIIASGKGSSMPHYFPSMTKKIENNDILLIDMGCIFNGYNSDLTRTVFLGNITPEFRKIYNIVLKAQEEAISSVKPGITAGNLDKTARDIITGEGYGPQFGHSLGHGLGMEIHENPAIKNGSKFKLKKNTPFTIEPGIYIPDKGGVRIEDVIIARENGFENLTKSSKEIIIL
jgi:Xaa-Pro aminopeptidase